MDVAKTNEEILNRYSGRRTLILGDVNSGKTRLTRTIIQAFYDLGHAGRMAVLDLAPDEINGIGGKLVLTHLNDLLVLTCPIVPPRLTAQTEDQVQVLALENAAAIDTLFSQVISARRSILFINDASLYLQAGRLDRLITVLSAHSTTVINAYYGHKFSPTAFSLNERRQVDVLARHCDHVLHLKKK